MPEHSKVYQDISAGNLLKDMLIGNNKRKLVSATVLLIIAFLIHVKNKRSDFDPLRAERVEKVEKG